MKKTMIAVALAFACIGTASAKDIPKAELDALVKAGTVWSVDKLEAAVLAKYPGGRLEDGEVEKHRRGYVYEVEVTDANGDEWDIEVDATNGKIIKTEMD